MVWSTYRRLVWYGVPSAGRIDQCPAASSRMRAQTDWPSKRGKQSQSIEPSQLTSAAERRLTAARSPRWEVGSLVHLPARGRSPGQPRGPQVLDRPAPGPLRGRDDVVLGGFRVVWGVQLVERFDREPTVAKEADPFAVAGVELDPAAGPMHPKHPMLWPQ